MRITIIVGPFLPVPAVLGGAVEKVHLALAPEFARAGHQVTLVSREYADFANEEIRDGVRHLRIPSRNRTPFLGVNLFLDLFYARRAARRMPVSDVTVTNSFSLPLVLARRKAGKIYVNVNRFPKGQFALYGRADRFQAVSNAVAQAIAQQSPKSASRVRVIGNPVPDRYFAPGSDAPRRRTVLYVGRIAREKGLHLLIGAFAALPPSDWKLRIIGPHATAQGGDGDPYLEELKNLARPIGDRCEFTGPIFDQDALIGEYRAAAIFVYPSVAERGEAFGLAPLEAMASGCATIVSALACFDDFTVNGVNALTFDHRGSRPEAALAALLTRLMSDAEFAENIAKAGRQTALAFHTRAIAQKMLDDFQSLLDAPRES